MDKRKQINFIISPKTADLTIDSGPISCKFFNKPLQRPRTTDLRSPKSSFYKPRYKRNNFVNLNNTITTPQNAQQRNLKSIQNKKGSQSTDSPNLGSYEDKICPICFKFMVEPCKLPCGHILCSLCIVFTMKLKMECPLDNMAVKPTHYVYVNKNIQMINSEVCKYQFNKRQDEINNNQEWQLGKRMMAVEDLIKEDIKNHKNQNVERYKKKCFKPLIKRHVRNMSQIEHQEFIKQDQSIQRIENVFKAFGNNDMSMRQTPQPCFDFSKKQQKIKCQEHYHSCKREMLRDQMKSSVLITLCEGYYNPQDFASIQKQQLREQQQQEHYEMIQQLHKPIEPKSFYYKKMIGVIRNREQLKQQKEKNFAEKIATLIQRDSQMNQYALNQGLKKVSKGIKR